MANFTEADLDAATKFAEANYNIRVLRAVYEEKPWIGSWVEFEMRKARKTDFYVPRRLRNVAKVVTIRVPEYLCNTVLSCTAMKDDAQCTPNEAASYYRVGDQDLGIQCAPACFNLAPQVQVSNAAEITNPMNTKEKKDSPPVHVMPLNYNRAAKKCRMVNGPIMSFLEKPVYRSTARYEKRLNDMPTGFTRFDNSDVDAANSGISYKFNPTYCEYYDRKLVVEDVAPGSQAERDGTNMTCSLEWYERGIDAVLGMTLINTVKSGVRELFTGSELKAPTNLIAIPETLPPEYTLDGWKKNINPKFVLPKLLATDTISLNALAFDPEEERRRQQKNKNKNKNKPPKPEDGGTTTTTTTTPKPKPKDRNKPKKNKNRQRRAAGDDEEVSKGPVDPNRPVYDSEREKALLTKLRDFVTRVMGNAVTMVTTPEFYEMLAYDMGANMGLDQIRKMAVRVSEKMLQGLATNIPKYAAQGIGDQVLSVGIKQVFSKATIESAIRLGAQSGIVAAKFLAASASVVGWVLIVGFVVDFLLSSFNVYGYTHLMSNGAQPQNIMANGDRLLRQLYDGTNATEYTFIHLATTILGNDRMVEMQLSTLYDRILYLNSLTVNSNGMRIEKGVPLEVPRGADLALYVAQTEGAAKRVAFDEHTFDNYNAKFMVRAKLVKTLNFVGATMMGVGVALFLTNALLLSVVCLVIGLVLLAAACLSIYDNTFTNIAFSHDDDTPMHFKDNIMI